MSMNTPNTTQTALLQREVEILQADIVGLKTEIVELKHQDIAKLNEKVDQLLQLWQRAEGVLVFVKWTTAIGAVILAIYASIKLHVFGIRP